jgi:uncharacterized protein
MLVRVHVIPNSKEARVTKLSETDFDVKVDEKAEGGRANKRLVVLMSKHFNVQKSRVLIRSGVKSRDKVLEVIQD